jgi:uncharacterized protein with PIN domain
MPIGICQFVRKEIVLECPECKGEFNSMDVESQVNLTVDTYMYTISPCPLCGEIVATNCVSIEDNIQTGGEE